VGIWGREKPIENECIQKSKGRDIGDRSFNLMAK
jgi:hypothetical protein